MHSNTIQRRDDFGRHVRTQFELSEAGENNLVLDELQYQLDVLFGKGATQQSKLISLNNIVRIFTSNMPIGAQKLLRRGAEDLFTQISPCLAEQQLVPSVLALILAISCNNDGSLSPNISIPSNILPIFLACGKFEGNFQSADADQLPPSFAAPIVTSVDESTDNNKSYRKKRKFGAAVHQSDPPPVPLPLSESHLVRHYGSKRSITEDSQTAMSETSQVVSASGSSQSDDYWTDDFFLAPQSAAVESALKEAPPTEPSASAPTGGFHRKRKLGNGNSNSNNNNSNNTSDPTSLPVPISVPINHTTNDTVKGITADATSSSATDNPLRQRFHAIYSTFMTTNNNSKDTIHSTSLANQCTHVLHLILLNRYLSTRVQALATVKTDMFLSTDNTDPDADQPESNVLTQHSNTAHNTEPHDSSNSNYDSDYRAQAESLTQIQCSMREEAIEQAPFLGQLCEDVYAECTAVTMSKLNTNINTISKDCGKLNLSTMWLSLGVLDSACFRCPQNQSYLANHTMWPSAHRNSSAHSTQDSAQNSPQETNSPSTLPSILSSFLQHTTCQLLSLVLQQHHQEVAVRAWKHNNNSNSNTSNNSSNINRVQVNSPIGSIGRFGTPIVASQTNNNSHSSTNNYRSPLTTTNKPNSSNASIPPSTGRSTGTTTASQPMLPIEWEKFRNLFPEIPVVLSTHTSNTTDGIKVPKDSTQSSAHNSTRDSVVKKRKGTTNSVVIDTIDSGGSQWEDDDPLELSSQYSVHSSPAPVVSVSRQPSKVQQQSTPVRSPLFSTTTTTTANDAATATYTANHSCTTTGSDRQGRQEGGKEGGKEGEKEVKAVVGLSEVCTAALKTLVSLSHDCQDTVQALVTHNNNQQLPTKEAKTTKLALSSTESAQHSAQASSQRSPLPSQLQLSVSSLRNTTSNQKSNTSYSNSHSMGTVPWAVAMLAWCAAWRCSFANPITTDSAQDNGSRSKKGGKDKPIKGMGSVRGALSPDETALERFVFDLMLYLQSLLTNIAEFSASAVATTAVWPCLYAYDIFSYLPDSTAHNTCSVSYLSEKCPLLCHLLSHTDPASARGAAHKYNSTNMLHTLCVSDLLVEILHLEAIDFLVDLEETDEAINNNNQPLEPQQSAIQTSPLKAQRTTSTTSAAPSSGASATAGGKKGKDSERNVPVPVAELIVSAHAALLLHTLTSSSASSSSSFSPNCVPSGEAMHQRRIEPLVGVNSPGMNGVPSPAGSTQAVALNQETAQRSTEQAGLSRYVRTKLPRGNWWLCVRVLKAFLTLQGQTGIMLLENLSPVLAAVQSMAKQDNPQPPAALLPAASGDALTVSLKVASEHYDSPEIPKALLNPPASASVNKNNTRHAQKNHTQGQEQHQSQGQSQSAHKRSLVDLNASDLPGKIDFLDLWAEEAPKAKRIAVSAETKPLNKSSSLGGAQAQDKQTQERGQGEWVWDGRDYVWQSASSVAVVGPLQAKAAPLRAAGSESLYKTSFRAREESMTTCASTSSVAAPAPVASLLTALPRSKLSGVRRFASANEKEEEEVEEVKRKLEQDEAGKETIPQKGTRVMALAILPSTGATVSASRTVFGSSESSVAVNDEVCVPVKESTGFRAKRKSFGAPQVPVQPVPPQDWLE